MQTSAKISADSISPAGHRLTTFEATFPRIILSELNTHRVLSRNSASSRAIPVEKMIARVLEDPYVPTHWGKNQRGMAAEQDVEEEIAGQAHALWLNIKNKAADAARALMHIGIHKQITNRLLEPFMFHTALITGTEYSNFFNLRDNKDAHPDFRDLAHAMRELYGKNEPWKADYGHWHVPLVQSTDWDHVPAHLKTAMTSMREVDEFICKVSVGRCARVSYLTHDGKRDPLADVELCERLLARGHMSPFEHVARPMTEHELKLFERSVVQWDGEEWVAVTDADGMPLFNSFLGNLNGWVQYRKLIAHEHDILGPRG